LTRVAYIDIDAHHGDGVFYAFEDDPDVADADVHEDGRHGTSTEASDPAGLSHCATSAHASHGGVACAVEPGARRRMEIRPAP
jgi:acetoin utilization deacetylase AcuC-like enzyme